MYIFSGKFIPKNSAVISFWPFFSFYDMPNQEGYPRPRPQTFELILCENYNTKFIKQIEHSPTS